MTLEEYEKILEEKRKAVLALKAEERKVEVDKELQAMQVLSIKKNNDEVFIKLVSYLTCPQLNLHFLNSCTSICLIKRDIYLHFL